LIECVAHGDVSTAQLLDDRLVRRDNEVNVPLLVFLDPVDKRELLRRKFGDEQRGPVKRLEGPLRLEIAERP
jgi:hypothetical protein